VLATEPKASCSEIVTSSNNNVGQGGEAHGEDGRELHIDSFGVDCWSGGWTIDNLSRDWREVNEEMVWLNDGVELS
jgi:hypothetical protein